MVCVYHVNVFTATQLHNLPESVLAVGFVFLHVGQVELIRPEGVRRDFSKVKLKNENEMHTHSVFQ